MNCWDRKDWRAKLIQKCKYWMCCVSFDVVNAGSNLPNRCPYELEHLMKEQPDAQ